MLLTIALYRAKKLVTTPGMHIQVQYHDVPLFLDPTYLYHFVALYEETTNWGLDHQKLLLGMTHFTLASDVMGEL